MGPSQRAEIAAIVSAWILRCASGSVFIWYIIPLNQASGVALFQCQMSLKGQGVSNAR